MPGGIEDDTFLHIVDAWWGSEIDRRRAAGELDQGDVEPGEVEEGFDEFVDCKGDRFEDAADLELHLEEWVSLYGGDGYPEARKMLEEVLQMWQAISPGKGRRGGRRRRG